jgi:hypothetical protein
VDSGGRSGHDLDATPTRYGPQPPVPTKLDAYGEILEARPAPTLEPVVRPLGNRHKSTLRDSVFLVGVRYALLVVLSYSRLLWCQFIRIRTCGRW